MGQESNLNEAEFQASLVARLRSALPLLPATIKVEHYLSLRLGRRAMTIDGKDVEKGTIQGRYDVLVFLDVTPLILAELKAPEEELTENDIGQALSYARLHQPMVPLVLVSNGKKHHLRRTYDGRELEQDDIGPMRLKAVLEGAATLAALATEEAIRTLLGASGKVWRQLCKAWNDETIAELTSGVRDVSHAVAREFEIPRDAVRQIESKLADGTRVIILHGPPLAGVTNALAQFARSTEAAPVLLIDAVSAPDVLQYVANRLSRELSIGVSKDDLRSWLNTRKGLLDVTLAIDGQPKNGVEELLDFANAGLLRLVLGMNSEEYRTSSRVAGRIQHSLAGRSAVTIELLPLSDDEFYGACELLAETFGAYFHNGAQHVPNLRFPRRLRAVAGTLPGKIVPTAERSQNDMYLMIPPIPGPAQLVDYSRTLVSDPALRYDLHKLAEAFLADASGHAGDRDWTTATWGSPSVDPAILEAGLGETRVKRLCDLGFLSWVDTRSIGPRLLVRIEELLTHDVAAIWAKKLVALVKQATGTFGGEMRRLLDLTLVVPAGEVALASAILQAARHDFKILGTIVPYLVGQKPVRSKIAEGARVDLLLKDVAIQVEFGKGTDEWVVGNIEAWVVLSHLAALPMAVADFDLTLNFSIFTYLGTSPHLLIYPHPVYAKVSNRFHFHDFEGVGSVLCLSSGIVEPLVQSIMIHAHECPKEFMWLAGQAIEKKNLHLGWRVLTVAIALRDSTDEAVAKAAEVVESALRDWWKQFISVAIEQHGHSPEHVSEVPAPTLHRPAVVYERGIGEQITVHQEATKVNLEEIVDVILKPQSDS